MDRMIYTLMSGASQTLNQQATVAHNLANLSSTGFRAERAAAISAPVSGDGLQTRTFVVDSTPGADFTPGTIQHTGRELDVAIQGQGWIAVQAADGSEAYTRNGNLRLNVNGLLQTSAGQTVLGDGGPISIPADTQVTIAKDGTISTVPTGNRPAANSAVGRIKLVNPPEANLVRGDDGLFRVPGGSAAPVDPKVRITSNSLESSNVNAVEGLISMIELARQYDTQMKMLQNAEASAKDASQLLTLPS